jgi:microsomal epoxide hydrolase
MSSSFRQIPKAAISQPCPFNISISDADLEDFRQLLKLSKLGRTTFEGLQQDRKYGITREWLANAREKLLDFDW